MNRKTKLKIFIGIAALVLANSSLFIVNQTEQAIILEFKKPVYIVKQPGINTKMPWQSVQFFDSRILDYNAPVYTIVAGDQKRLEVDAFLKYRIKDPLKYLRSTGGNFESFQGNLSTVLESALRKAISEVPLNTLLTSKRRVLMHDVKELVNQKGQGFGIEVVDVRIMRADFPQQNQEDIYSRMRSEREREAKNLRAQGAEQATKIRAEADKQKTIILAEGQKTAQITKGEGDGEASKIYASAFGKDPDFYKFYRTMQAYRESLKKEDTKLVLSPRGDFLKYLNNSE
jgi:membrane protease subunit HflC